MRNPFNDGNAADGWFNNLWTENVDLKQKCMYGNTGTDMLFKSLCPRSPELEDIICRADEKFGLGDTLKSLFALLYLKEPQKNNGGAFFRRRNGF